MPHSNGTLSRQPDFSRALRERGLKATRARLEVLDMLSRATRPLSITQIVAALPAQTFKVTVYRVLANLRDAGLVRQVDFQRAHAFYELADPADHHHLVCLRCDRVEDFTGCEADRIAARALKRSRVFASVTGHSFELFGLCKYCQP